jgi:transcriptional regulator with XRE-family HTH domain
MDANEIARRMGISRNTVLAIIEQKGAMPDKTRRDKIVLDEDLLRKLYQDCDGWIQRVHEKLGEEEGIQIKYSTLTRMMRTLGISRIQEERCERVPDTPGAEMQHDTSSYWIKLSGTLTKLIASLMYLRYSKRRYLRFYRRFNRFRMQCFFHEALMHWGCAATECIIDNTSLARLRGTGKNAVIVPEMAAFAKQYRFHFRCHERGHSDRKAGEERSFYTVETNFFPGRRFENLEDLNRQAFEWATVRMNNRPVAKTGLIPAKAFEHEIQYLLNLSPHQPPPYRIHERPTDQYGYIAFDGNYYWVPGTKREDTRVLEYDSRLKIYLNRKCVAEYPLSVDGMKNQRFSPEGMPAPRHQPNNRKRPTEEEEKRLRAMSPSVNAYLDFALKNEGGIRRHHFVRKLFLLSRRMTSELFIQSIERALRYRIASVETIERIALLYMTQDAQILPDVDVDEDFQHREAYLEGRLTDAPDFSIYEKMLEEEDDG